MGEDEADVIVLGLGGIGSAAAYWLSKRGARVIGLEQFELGHDRGESQDHSRIIRLSYHDPHYVRLAQAAYASWAEVEARVGRPARDQDGRARPLPRGRGIDQATTPRAHGRLRRAVRALGGRETMRRYPQFRLDEDVETLFQEQSGIAAAARANAAHQRLALGHGADLREGARVEAIETSGDEVSVRAADARCARAS